jgi:hypothetical protein
MIDWQAEHSDKFIGTTAAILTAVAAAAGTGGVVYSANKQAGAASDAAAIETNAQKYAADLQAKGAADALAFTKAQGENAFQNSEAARQGNYGMYAAAQRRLGAVGDLIGAGPREIPAYVPGVDPNFTGTAAPAASGAPAPGGSDPVTQAILDNYKALGVAPTGPGTGPTDVAYMVKQAKASLAAGERPLSYWLGPQGRIAQELAQAKSGGAPAAAAPIGSVGSYLQATPTPYAAVPVGRALQMPGSAASYLNG